jgi:hypothetical protein
MYRAGLKAHKEWSNLIVKAIICDIAIVTLTITLNDVKEDSDNSSTLVPLPSDNLLSIQANLTDISETSFTRNNHKQFMY